jgi:hypothetical protein
MRLNRLLVIIWKLDVAAVARAILGKSTNAALEGSFFTYRLVHLLLLQDSCSIGLWMLLRTPSG